MEICKLCKEREATKTNSHLITWSLIKDAVSQSGVNDRGYEVTFSISTYDAPSLYIGRSVLPEQIEKITKRRIEDNVIDQKNDPFSRDNIFCPTCETSIGKLENEFINCVYSKLVKNQSSGFDKKGNKVIRLAEYESKLTYVFAYSIFFRISIGSFNNYPLDTRIESDIRQMLVSVLDIDEKVTKQNVSSVNPIILAYPLMFCYLETDINSDNSENVVMQNRCNRPYFIWANRVIFQLFKKQKQIESANEYFYGLSEFVNIKEYFGRDGFKEIKICVLSNEKREELLKNALASIADIKMKNIKTDFNTVCKKVLKRNATLHEKNVFGYHYSNYSTEKFQNTIVEAFIKSFEATFNIKLT